MNYFKKNVWILPIIGGLIALISVLTPVTTWNPTGSFGIQWMFQIGFRLEPFIEFSIWRTDPGLLSLSITFSVLIFASAITLIISTIFFKRSLRSFQKLRWFWLLLALIIALSTLAWIIMIEIYYNINGYNHWSAYGGDYSPSFGVIGPFIGSAFIIIGFVLRSISKIQNEI